jgi:tRNA-dependent cyclodipeptide synthase
MALNYEIPSIHPQHSEKKARFLYVPKCSAETVFHSKAILGISIGNPACEGEKLAATINLINTKFATCDVSIADTLHRHTLQIGSLNTPEELYEQAKKAGDAWLERNREILNLFTIPYTIFRWDTFLQDPLFNLNKEKITTLYSNNIEFRNAVNKTISTFMHRQLISLTDEKQAFLCCKNYILEETAAVMFTWKAYQYNYVLYPNTISPCMEWAHNTLLSPSESHLVRWLPIRIRSKGIR